MDCEFCGTALSREDEFDAGSHERCEKIFESRQERGVCVVCDEDLGEWAKDDIMHELCRGNQYVGYPIS